MKESDRKKKNKGNTNDACLQPAANNVSSVQVFSNLRASWTDEVKSTFSIELKLY